MWLCGSPHGGLHTYTLDTAVGEQDELNSPRERSRRINSSFFKKCCRSTYLVCNASFFRRMEASCWQRTFCLKRPLSAITRPFWSRLKAMCAATTCWAPATPTLSTPSKCLRSARRRPGKTISSNCCYKRTPQTLRRGTHWPRYVRSGGNQRGTEPHCQISQIFHQT